RPADREDCLALLRAALARAPRPCPEPDGVPFTGGLVGVAGYDVVRMFEKLPGGPARQPGIPDAAFVATDSLLVFDHLTRRVALLHAGPESERQALRTEVMRLLRGAVPGTDGRRGYSRPVASLDERAYAERVARCKEHIAAGDIYQIVLSVLFSGRTDIAP